MCAPGYGGGSCAVCDKGFWSAGGAEAACTACGAGLTTTKATGAIAAADCDGKVCLVQCDVGLACAHLASAWLTQPYFAWPKPRSQQGSIKMCIVVYIYICAYKYLFILFMSICMYKYVYKYMYVYTYMHIYNIMLLSICGNLGAVV